MSLAECVQWKAVNVLTGGEGWLIGKEGEERKGSWGESLGIQYSSPRQPAESPGLIAGQNLPEFPNHTCPRTSPIF